MADPRLQVLAEALRRYSEEDNPLIDRRLEEEKAPIRRRALLLLQSRQRSKKELKDRLLRLDFDEELVESVLADCERSGLVDDRAFAAEWVRQRHQLKHKSASALDCELADKGVPAHIRAEVVAEISDDDEYAAAYALAQKKVKGLRTPPENRQEEMKTLRRIVGALARRGFGSSMSMDIATEVLSERVAELTAGEIG